MGHTSHFTCQIRHSGDFVDTLETDCIRHTFFSLHQSNWLSILGDTRGSCEFTKQGESILKVNETSPTVTIDQCWMHILCVSSCFCYRVNGTSGTEEDCQRRRERRGEEREKRQRDEERKKVARYTLTEELKGSEEGTAQL